MPRLTVQRYGADGFRIGGENYDGAVLVVADRVVRWPVTSTAAATIEQLAPVLAQSDPPVRMLLVGCGIRIAPFRPELTQALRHAGIAVEFMDTGAACRTFDVLVGDGRAAAAALIPPGGA